MLDFHYDTCCKGRQKSPAFLVFSAFLFDAWNIGVMAYKHFNILVGVIKFQLTKLKNLRENTTQTRLSQLSFQYSKKDEAEVVINLNKWQKRRKKWIISIIPRSNVLKFADIKVHDLIFRYIFIKKIKISNRCYLKILSFKVIF